MTSLPRVMPMSRPDLRVAFLTASCMFKSSPDARKDHWEHDLEWDQIQPACLAEGIQLEARIWDSPDFDPSLYDAVVIGTTWDYMEKPDQFGGVLAECAARSKLLNPLPTVMWNKRKTYLKDLEARGAPMIPTVWARKADEATIAAAFETLECEDIVVKPVMGAGAWRQARVKKGEALPQANHLPPAEAMIQPFLPSVSEEGEYAFLFFNREFSHCALKRPAKGDYRVQSEYGGFEAVHTPSAEELALAKAVIDSVEGDLLYARVDMLRGLDGRLALIELELIEPYLYPEQGPDFGANFARALKALI